MESLTDAEAEKFLSKKKKKSGGMKIVLCGGCLVTDKQITMVDDKAVNL